MYGMRVRTRTHCITHIYYKEKTPADSGRSLLVSD